MAEQQPMYAYWDQQASQAAASTTAGSSPQQQSNSASLHQQQEQAAASGQQRFSLDSVNYASQQQTGANAPSSFAGGAMPHPFGNSNTSHPQNASTNNQESVRQLQQNLMLMLQQQSEQLNASDQASLGNNSHQSQHSGTHQDYKQQSKNDAAAAATAKPSGMLPNHHMFSSASENNNNNNNNHEDSTDLMAQYRHMFGVQDNEPDAAASSSSNRMNETVSPSSSRLFALGGMVKPLPPNKPHPKANDKSMGRKPPKISASSLGMSESSSDFMMKLFQNDGGGSQQQKQSSFSNFPFQQNMTSGGSATAALEQLQSNHQQQPEPTQAFSGGFSSNQQQNALNLQEQLRQKQEQLRLLQQQLTDPQPQHTQLQQQQQQQLHELEPLPQASQDDGFGLPCTMLPPSVLASMFSVETHTKPKAVPHKAGKSHIKARKRRYNVSLAGDDAVDMKPQDVLGELLDRRNYDKEHRFKADDSGYDAVPSPLQLASFGTNLVKAVQKSDIQLLSSLLECGLSPNPCNQFRDSVFFDLVIKRSNLPVFECLLNHGCDLQVVDGFGRTPLHHCCWASTFCRPIVEIILERDPVQIFLEDKHGQTPLEYVRANLYGEWNDFLEEVADKYWPMGGQPSRIVSPKEQRPDGHLPDPQNALSVTLASMLSSGSISPEQVASMDENTRRSYEN